MLHFEAKRELERIEPVVEVIVVASPAAMLASTPSALALSPDGDASHGTESHVPRPHRGRAFKLIQH